MCWKYCTYLQEGSGSSAWYIYICIYIYIYIYIYNYNSEQFVVKASKFLCNFIFLIILCQQFFKHFSIYISVFDEFFI